MFACQCQCEQQAQQRTGQHGLQQRQARAQGDIPCLALRPVAQVSSAVFQARINARLATVRQVDVFLDIEVRGERRRVTLLLARAQRPRQGIQYTQDLDGIVRIRGCAV